MTYDEKTCVTAAQLRTAGINVPPDIPDCAWIPRAAMDCIIKPAALSSIDRRELVMNVEVVFREPFQWIEIKGTVS